MDILTEDALTGIFKMLPVDDLLSCCLVCVHWRNIINRSVIWRPHCNPNLKLEERECTVEPAFEAPQLTTCERLSPVSAYRLNYMRQVHLLNNIKNKRFTQFVLPKEKYVVIGSLPEEKYRVFGSYLIVDKENNREIEVWEVRGKPMLVKVIQYPLQEGAMQFIGIVGNHLFVVQNTLIQVYSSEDEFRLKKCGWFEDDELSNGMPVGCDVSHDNCITCLVNEDFFIGITGESQNAPTIHIRDMKTGSKLAREQLPQIEGEVPGIDYCSSSENLFISIRKNNQTLKQVVYSIYCYSLKTFQYTDFLMEIPVNLCECHNDFQCNFLGAWSPAIVLCYKKFLVIGMGHESSEGYYDSDGYEMYLIDTTTKNINKKVYCDFFNVSRTDSRLVICKAREITIMDLDTLEVNSILSTEGFLNYNAVLQGRFLILDSTYINSRDGMGNEKEEGVIFAWDYKAHCQLYSIGIDTIGDVEDVLGRAGPLLLLKLYEKGHKITMKVISFW